MNRGMKKWAPYRSLNEQSDYIYKMQYDKHKIEKPLISEDEANLINELLINYKNEPLIIRYYDDGYCYEIQHKLYKIDTTYHRIYLDRCTYIDFKNVLSLKIIETD